MNILITGVTGFIGRNLYERLKNKHEIFVLVRKSSNTTFIEKKNNIIIDTSNSIDLERQIRTKNIEFVFHLASLYINKHKPKDVSKLIDSNICFGARLLEAATNAGIKYFINTGTLFQHYNQESYNPVNLYAATKQSFEDLAKYYYEVYDLNFVTLKLGDTYGPGDSRKKIFDLWKNIAETGEKLNMSQGEQIIDIVYIDDVIDAFVLLMTQLVINQETKLKGKTFAINSKERMSLKKLAKKFEQISGKKLNIKWGAMPYRNREVMKPAYLNSINGWKQKVFFDNGIKYFLKGNKNETVQKR